MTPIRIWLRRSSGLLAMPAIVGVVAVVVSSRSNWYYEWDRAMSWASASTILLGPVLAGLTAFDVARRLGPTLGTLTATTRRGLRGVLAIAIVIWVFGVAGWALGTGYAAIRARLHDAAGAPDPWVFVQAPSALLASAALGLVVGLLVRNVMAGPAAALLVYLVPITFRPLADAGVLATGGATGSVAGLEPDPVVASTALMVNFLVVLLAIAVAAFVLLPKTRMRMTALIAAGVGVLAAGAFLTSLDPMLNAFRPDASPATCVGTGTQVCGPAASGALLQIAARDLEAARTTVRDAGIDTVASYRMTQGLQAPPPGNDGMLAITADGLESGRMGAWDIALTLATPTACSAYWADEPPERLLEQQRRFAEWVLDRLAGDPLGSSELARAQDWYENLVSCDGPS